MNDMMTFPDTWEEYEKIYGFNDSDEIYTNNSRLIPSFRVKSNIYAVCAGRKPTSRGFVWKHDKEVM